MRIYNFKCFFKSDYFNTLFHITIRKADEVAMYIYEKYTCILCKKCASMKITTIWASSNCTSGKKIEYDA